MVFSLFNTFKMMAPSITAWKKNVQLLAHEFEIEAKIPDDFFGVMSENGCVWGCNAKPDLTWALFTAALELAKSDSPDNRDKFAKLFDAHIDAFEQGPWIVTLWLSWVRPNRFLGLQLAFRKLLKRNEFLGEGFAGVARQLLKEEPNGKQYLRLCDECQRALETSSAKAKSFPELNFEAQLQTYDWLRTRFGDSDGGSEKASAPNGIRCWIYTCTSFYKEDFEKGIMTLGLAYSGDLSVCNSEDEIFRRYNYPQGTHACWEFSHEMKIGDVIFAWNGNDGIFGRGIVRSDYEYHRNHNGENFGWRYHGRKVEWTHKFEEAAIVQGENFGFSILNEITNNADLLEKIQALFDENEASQNEIEEAEIVGEEEVEEVETANLEPYTKEDFLAEVFVSEADYERLARLLETKKNLILQGAPGVGKTFLAKRLAYALMGVKDASRVSLVQFHQSYSYEDFVMGYRPCEAGFELRTGAFYDFCKSAEGDPGNAYFFIIDEINRGNLSKIFGELFMLIEGDKRGPEYALKLLYSGETFHVPKNLHLIGMMNTADRSLALLDYALRRRFVFFELRPAFDSPKFNEYAGGIGNEKFRRLVRAVVELNKRISADPDLGAGFQIGHSFLCNLSGTVTDAELEAIVEFELVPLLGEYWFDEKQTAEEASTLLRRALD